MKKVVIGILAHVDAGKTTLSEGLLYLTGTVRRLGRVDHKDAFLDTNTIERERGITIFSKQAVLFPADDFEMTLLDTPGHVDFCAEMERTLQVLDYAILVISGTDGIQGHTLTLWQLLRQHRVPTFLFINKMDLSGADHDALLADLQAQLSDGCIDFCAPVEEIAEALAMTDEFLLEQYLAGNAPDDAQIQASIACRSVFPCYFGSALSLAGVDSLLEGLTRFAKSPCYPEPFGARVFKISRDEQGTRLTHLKITGGSLSVRAMVSGTTQNQAWQEKVHQIRIYSGTRFQTTDCALSGTVCAVAGLTQTYPGQALGAEPADNAALLTPILNYRILPPDGCDNHTLLSKLRLLEEEDPLLHVLWNEPLDEIHVQLMGQVQLEVLTRLMEERFGLAVTFDHGNIVYKETIEAPVIGIGHFEPLRHYAEVHLLLEPAPRGSGITLDTDCPTDLLDPAAQRLIVTHLAEKVHCGVLTGAPLTDVKITLLAGRAHVKHTEGGDFRQATYRAVRQGLMQADSLLLEPWYTFTLRIPQGMVGRAMTDIQRMSGSFSPPDIQGTFAVLSGEAPAASMRGYAAEVTAYTNGRGQLSCTVAGYRACHDAQAVIAQSGYDPERDLQNPPDSVFCAHGAGYTVKWNEVPAHAHVDSGRSLQASQPEAAPQRAAIWSGGSGLDAELEEIFVRTYGPIKNRGMDAFRQSQKRTLPPAVDSLSRVKPDDYLLVDGYNIIFAWDELKALAAEDLDAARAALIHALSNYQGVKRCRLILVFDAYRVKDNPGSIEKLHGIHVVYTKTAETADMYIEKASYDLSRAHRVKVATSDGLEQAIILGHGAERISANDLYWEVQQANQQIQDFLKST